MKKICIPKPTNRVEFVNLYASAISAFQKADPELHEYMLEPNICNDCAFEEIFNLLTSYYSEVRTMHVRLEESNEVCWTFALWK